VVLSVLPNEERWTCTSWSQTPMGPLKDDHGICLKAETGDNKSKALDGDIIEYRHASIDQA